MDFNDFYQKNVNIFGFAPFCKLLKEREAVLSRGTAVKDRYWENLDMAAGCRFESQKKYKSRRSNGNTIKAH